MTRMLIDNDEMKVTFEDSKELRDQVFERLLKYYREHEAFDGEVIMQSDGPQIDAAPTLSDIADDILSFEVVWK